MDWADLAIESKILLRSLTSDLRNYSLPPQPTHLHRINFPLLHFLFLFIPSFSPTPNSPQGYSVLGNPGGGHHPKVPGGGRHVKRGHQSGEQRDGNPCTTNPQKLEPAHHRGRENSQRYRRAKLQERACQDGSGMTLEIGGDGIARFPWSREMWFAGKADYEIKACVEQQGVHDR